MFTAENAWEMACRKLEQELPGEEFDTWLHNLDAESFDGEMLTLRAPFRLWKERVTARYQDALERALSEAIGSPCRVTVGVGEGDVGRTKRMDEANVHRRHPRALEAPHLNPHHTFETFLVGEPNRLAATALQQLATGQLTDPSMVIVGEAGHGKTHLLEATAHALMTAGKHVTHYGTRPFLRRLATVRDSGKEHAWRRTLLETDALLIDDVHALNGRDNSALLVSSIVTERLAERRTTVLTSSVPIEELRVYPAELLERLSSGLVVTLDPLDCDLRRRLLTAKCALRGVALQPRIVEQVAVELKGSVLELEGFVARLAHSYATGASETNDDVSALLGRLLPPQSATDIDKIVNVVAYAHGLTTEEMLSRDRRRRIAWPRHIAAYLARILTPSSLPAIGQALGGRNHTSILRAVRAVRERKEGDLALDTRLETLAKMIRLHR